MARDEAIPEYERFYRDPKKQAKGERP